MEKLVLKNVSYLYKNKYQTVHAVKDVSHTFMQGKFYAIVGKSGSGKTTLLSMMAGLDFPSSGEIIYDKRNIATLNLDIYRLKNVAVIYQNFNLFPLLTVLENVMFPLQLHSDHKKDAKSVALRKIQSVGLDSSLLQRYPSMLSGGEQQRVAIARALTTEVDVILADEPTGNLDKENSNNIINILKELALTENYCVIVVTHDISIVEQADIVLKMQDGRFVEE